MEIDALIEFIVKNLDKDRAMCYPSANLRNDLDFNSFEMVELVVLLEEEYNIKIPDEALWEIKTLYDFLNVCNIKK